MDVASGGDYALGIGGDVWGNKLFYSTLKADSAAKSMQFLVSVRVELIGVAGYVLRYSFCNVQESFALAVMRCAAIRLYGEILRAGARRVNDGTLRS